MARTVAARIRRFVGDAFVLEGKGPLLAAAAAACTAGVIALPAPQAGETDGFSRMVSEVRSRIRAEMPWANVHVVDMRSPLGEQVDIASVDAGTACLVYSAPTADTAAHLGVADAGDAGPQDYARWIVWTEVGNCLGADDPRRAKAFGAMMTVLDTGSSDFLPLLAEATERHETEGGLHYSEVWSETARAAIAAMEYGAITDALEVHGIAAALEISRELYVPDMAAGIDREDRVRNAPGLTPS